MSDHRNKEVSLSKTYREDIIGEIFGTIEKILGDIPASEQTESKRPDDRARELVRSAAIKAATISGTLALPPGPLGLLTILPDLMAIWRLQAQLVSDIAAAYGWRGKLTQEAMLYCLFRHAVAHGVRDLVVRVGERMIIKRPSLRVIQTILETVGTVITQRLAGRGITRLLPFIGALGVAGYAYYDTAQVGKAAMDLFSKDIEIENAVAK